MGCHLQMTATIMVEQQLVLIGRTLPVVLNVDLPA